MPTAEGEYDVFKDSPIRLLGYANEVGEALRGFIGAKWVHVSYGVATLYVVADTVDKTGKTYMKHSNQQGCIPKTIFAASDTLVWQMLASVIIPGYSINRVCALADYTLRNNFKLPTNNRKFMVTVCGLGVIPFIIKPIDRLVDFLLDVSLRKLAPYK